MRVTAMYEEVLLHEFAVDVDNPDSAEAKFKKMANHVELDFSYSTLVEGKLVKVTDSDGKSKKLADSYPDLEGKALNPSKIEIPLGDGNKLVAEKSSDPQCKEMYIYIENAEGVVWQDLVVVREKYDLENDIVPIHGLYEVLLYSDPDSEDYVGAPIVIQLRHEEE